MTSGKLASLELMFGGRPEYVGAQYYHFQKHIHQMRIHWV